MYCYTIINNLKCVLSELETWSKDSMEHHTFILKFADCRNIRLGYNLTNEIRESRRYFKEFNEEINDVIAEYESISSYNHYAKLLREIKRLLQRFIKYDKKFLSILKDLQTIGRRDNIWQTLIDHIFDEQKYSFRLMKNLKRQLN
ncbi:DUF2935 domain-containing protein [Paramaledivibacter caminithermalis]|jgi:hypothetical protein|uniref:Uncharacterized protein n=1 Tax=Paramaledivibacter caminithermalis (strain DSM 15212 / CIP 107654 / DViRD3) TaxID=1121301 RepID=A0A1M6LGE4_PARC5|nr:DUF2935 domain-containing protein [Paramaledivibacter caminithermalis]SHJ70246.1 protein of unknown function [Paramaledivibacter caminithermalis DSM 15212]